MEADRLPALRARLDASEIGAHWRTSLTRRIESATGAQRDELCELIEVVLENPRAHWDCAIVLDNALSLGGPGDARLSHDVVKALLVSVAARQRTYGDALGALHALVAADAAELPALRLAALRPPPTRLDRAHTLLLHAARAAPPASLVDFVAHANGPPLQLSARATAEATLWLATRARDFVPAAERAVHQALSGAARRALDSGDGKPLAAATQTKVKSPAAKLARAACVEADKALTAPDKGGASARAAAKAMVLLLGNDVAAVRRFLEDFDAELTRLDCTSALARREKRTSCGVAGSIHRAAGPDGRANLWLMRLADGSCALLAKLGARWALVEGGEAEVIASVPGDAFAPAAGALAGAAR